MKSNYLNKTFRVAVLASAVGATLAVSTVSAADLDDIAEKQRTAEFRAAVSKEIQTAVQKQSEKQRQNDRQAEEAQECKDIFEAGKMIAENAVRRNTPPDPTKIIQNTTCFTDLSAVKIPVIVTGMGFIDSIIKAAIQRFLTGACSKAQNFLGDLQSTAMSQLNNGIGGALNFGYSKIPSPVANAAESLLGANLGDLQSAGTNLSTGLMGNLTQVGAGSINMGSSYTPVGASTANNNANPTSTYGFTGGVVSNSGAQSTGGTTKSVDANGCSTTWPFLCNDGSNNTSGSSNYAPSNQTSGSFQ